MHMFVDKVKSNTVAAFGTKVGKKWKIGANV